MSTDVRSLHVNELKNELSGLSDQLDALFAKQDRGDRMSERDLSAIPELDARAEALYRELRSRPAVPSASTHKPEARSITVTDTTRRIGGEEAIYHPGGANHYIRDLIVATTRSDFEAADRLRRHDAQIRDEAERRVSAGQIESATCPAPMAQVATSCHPCGSWTITCGSHAPAASPPTCANADRCPPAPTR